MINSNTIPVVIPYLAEEAQGDELELAVTGWRKHFIQPHQIYIVGDPHPIISSGDDITYLECPKVKKGEFSNECYLPHIDIGIKLGRAAYELIKWTDRFIYTCDDIYPVNDFSLIEILAPKVMGKMSGRDANCDTGWWGDLQRAKRICEAENLPTWDWVCHLPVLFDTFNLLTVMGEYGFFNKTFVLENVYFNRTYDNRVPLVLNGSDNFKFAVNNHPYDSYELERALLNKIFITNSVSGWSKELEDRLRKHYNNQ